MEIPQNPTVSISGGYLETGLEGLHSGGPLAARLLVALVGVGGLGTLLQSVCESTASS